MNGQKDGRGRTPAPGRNGPSASVVSLPKRLETKMVSSEKSLAELLMQNGIIAETLYRKDPEERILEQQRYRRENYMNVKALLKSYRKLKRQYIRGQSDIMDVLNESKSIRSANDSDQVSSWTDIMSELSLQAAEDERLFNARYLPYLVRLRRIELVTSSLMIALKMLEDEEPTAANLIKFFYIEGERQPKMEEASEMLQVSTATLYGRLEKIELKLAENMFGFNDKSQELSLAIAQLCAPPST